MGIPALFRWLTQKYPKVTSSAIEEQPRVVNGITIPVDFSQPNPNGFEVDNLYLDMNNIIHPCCHPEDKPAPKNEDEMYVEIFKYIDRIVAMARPRKVLYMAIDGVAPRAKMNQQRSRRFRAATEASDKVKDEARVREEYEATHGKLPEKELKEAFDSNCITPGTPFMTTLSTALKYYIASNLNSNPGWRNLKVVLSDASIPGEGEHKVMDFIRRQRNSPEYDAQTMHVLYGLDADLIMLALATHEPHFKILREDVFFADKQNKGCFICGQEGHQASQCTGKAKEKSGQHDEIGQNLAVQPYVFLHVAVLREYLDIQLKVNDLPFKWDIERAIDDYVFLCFFVGNDFLPHLPSLEIREGAIDVLIEIWKKNLVKFGGYMTDSGDISLERAATLLVDLGFAEDAIFKKRRDDEERRRQGRKRREDQQTDQQLRRLEIKAANAAPQIALTMGSIPTYGLKDRVSKEERHRQNMETLDSANSGVTWGGPKNADRKVVENKNASILLKQQMLMPLARTASEEGFTPVKRKASLSAEERAILEGGSSPFKSIKTNNSFDILGDEVISEGAAECVVVDSDQSVEGDVEDIDSPESIEDTMEKLAPLHEDEPADNVRLWEQGWKKRYYKNKFQVDENDAGFRRDLVTSYVEGCCWVLKYYYQGCPSWQWFYPYHYSPFASDFDFIAELNITFDLGKPFKPYEQLMGVLPYASRMHIPHTFHGLMNNIDSPIIDFYPETFPVDLNGKKHAWQGVALLPFIDQDRLLGAMGEVYAGLSELEVKRNTIGNELLWVGQHHPAFDKMCRIFTKAVGETLPLDHTQTQSFFGTISRDTDICLPGTTFYSPLVNMGLQDLPDNQCISTFYYMPSYPVDDKFMATLLPTVRIPRKLLGPDDYYFVKMAGSERGGRGRGRGGNSRMNIESTGRFIRSGTDNNRYDARQDQSRQNNQSQGHSNQSDSSRRGGQANQQGHNTHQRDSNTHQRHGNYSEQTQQRNAYQSPSYNASQSYSQPDRFGNSYSSNNTTYNHQPSNNSTPYSQQSGSSYNNTPYSNQPNNQYSNNSYSQQSNNSYNQQSNNSYNQQTNYQQSFSSQSPSYANQSHQNQSAYSGQNQQGNVRYENSQPQRSSTQSNQTLPPKPPVILGWSRNVQSGRGNKK